MSCHLHLFWLQLLDNLVLWHKVELIDINLFPLVNCKHKAPPTLALEAPKHLFGTSEVNFFTNVQTCQYVVMGCTSKR